jgi:predicted O-linked N-acetylglucosamine transferase (SPINDLY family)
VRSALLLDLNYSCDDPKQIITAHKEWDAAISAPLRPQTPHENSRDPARRLRIGYVSSDFFRHPVAYFFEPLLQSHSANEFETYCYANVEKPDPVTGRLRALAHHWRDIRGMAPAAVADLVRSDSIDILVDLGGHTAPNLLLVFAHKPAPIQVTWLGYPNTTGMGAMDYRITDEWADPPGKAEAYHTEMLARLPNGFLCYRPFIKAPPVSPSPAARAGCVTFGSFNSLRKITPEVLKTWASILAAIPGSRLLLKRSPLRYATVAERYRRPFLEAGVEPDRVVLQDAIPSQTEHLALYSQVDVGLDSFPYNGTTTTCEALWMGVPVVCLAGNRHSGRVGVSILTQMELTDLIADSPDDYVRIAVELANTPKRLSELRSSLRQRMSVSPLCDAKAFARTMEDAYRKMWRNWCDT